MQNAPLANDYTRCYGYLCIKKLQCQRFITMAIDPPETLSYVNSMVDEQGECENFIEDKKASND